MISTRYRFHGRNSLRTVLSRGQTHRSDGLSLRLLPNPRRSNYRAAVIVSRKVHKSAVVRNRIRRRVYERVRILCAALPAAYDLVFLVYDEKIAEMPPAELDAQLQRLLRRAGLLPY